MFYAKHDSCDSDTSLSSIASQFHCEPASSAFRLKREPESSVFQLQREPTSSAFQHRCKPVSSATQQQNEAHISMRLALLL